MWSSLSTVVCVVSLYHIFINYPLAAVAFFIGGGCGAALGAGTFYYYACVGIYSIVGGAWSSLSNFCKTDPSSYGKLRFGSNPWSAMKSDIVNKMSTPQNMDSVSAFLNTLLGKIATEIKITPGSQSETAPPPPKSETGPATPPPQMPDCPSDNTPQDKPAASQVPPTSTVPETGKGSPNERRSGGSSIQNDAGSIVQEATRILKLDGRLSHTASDTSLDLYS
jgi:hypothetical protein